jgi:HK97 family phage major capsid protein
MTITLEEVSTNVGKLANAWEQFKQVNDDRLKEIEKKGKADPLHEEQLDKINKFMDEKETVISNQNKEIESLKTAINRAASASDTDSKAERPELVEHKKAFRNYLRKGVDTGLADMESKALSVQSDPDGGYLVPPTMSDRIVTRVFDTSPIRQIAGVTTISTDRLEGLRDTDESSGGWVSEGGARTGNTTTPQVGMWNIPVNEIYCLPSATQKLIDDASFDIETWLANKIGDKFSRIENTAFVNGNGVGQPQGFCQYATATTADSSRAWGTLQHVGTGNAGDFASSSPGDVLFDLIAQFKAPYLNNATWVTRRSVIQKIRKFKEATTNAYMWQPGLQAGQPDKLLGYPILMAEDMPALASGSLSLAFGNFKEAYQIVDRIGIRTLRDPYTSKPNVLFYTTKRVGGAVVQFEAIKFVKFS